MPKKKEILLDLYLKSISGRPLLTAEDEVVLAKRIEGGDGDAEKELAEANLRFVVFLAKKYVGRSLNLTLFGLIQEGNFGLLIAVKKFDWRKGCRFSTYASWWIRQSIQRALINDRRALSLDEQLTSGEDNYSLHDIVEDEKSASPSDRTNTNLLSVVLEGAMVGLNHEERTIISMSFGLNDGLMHNSREIAKVLGIRREKVRQLKNMALKKLKKNKKLSNLI